MEEQTLQNAAQPTGNGQAISYKEVRMSPIRYVVISLLILAVSAGLGLTMGFMFASYNG